jgi:DNA-binding beta-propeller fold protein YncE
MAVEKRRKENTCKIFVCRAAAGIVAALVLTVLSMHPLIPQSQIQKRIQAGPAPDGSFLLNTGWILQPAGKTIPLSTLPMSTAASPDGRRMAVLNGGFLPASVDFLDMETTSKTASVSITDGWRGLAFSAAGTRLYVGNGAHASITEFAVKGDQLTVSGKIDLFPGEPLQTPHLIADILPRDNNLLVVDTLQGRIYEVDPAPGKITRTIPVAPYPYSILMAPDRKSVYVSSWTTATVVQYALTSGKEVARIPVGEHPTEMVWLTRNRLAVACANSNFVFILGKDRQGKWQLQEKLNLALTPRQPVGMTPSSLSLSPNRQTLYIACSDANAIAVADVSGKESKVAGYIPTGWYPTTVRALRDGRLLVLNGKGSGSHPNPDGPSPFKWPVKDKSVKMEYVAAIQTGTASVIDAFTQKELDEYTRTVIANSPYRDSLLDNAGIPAGNPIPDHIGASTPIKHVILLMKENRTYDQVLGDMPEGNGDPALVLFGEKITPNHHKLARDFVLLDNFYVNADVSEDGLYWTTSAIASDSNQRTWPMEYAGRTYAEYGDTLEGARSAPGGFLWNKATEAGVSFYNYGFFAKNLPHPPDNGIQIRDVADPVLKPHTSFYFRQHDRTFSDIKRIQVFLNDLAGWEKNGDMPQLIVMTIGNDHTEGMRPGIRSPISCVADNDQSVGIMVEGLSRSKFWGSTAMFVLEDDAQDGADHVDSHRSLAYVISPYAKHHAVDNTFYNTTSVLRTIELILGLKPMTMFDAAAHPMSNAFADTPDMSAYTNEPPRVALDVKNPMTGPLAERSNKLDFSESDRADARELNDILWLAVRGTPPPAPVRSRFGK